MNSNISTSMALDISKLMRLDTANMGFQTPPRFLNIPNYQRNFTWEKKQVEELYDDFMNHHSSIISTNEISASENTVQNPKYYLGQIVLVSDGTKLNLLDGQQRLTTLYIFNSVLSYKFRNLKSYIERANTLDAARKAVDLAKISGSGTAQRGFLDVLKDLRFNQSADPWLMIKYENDQKHFNHIISDHFNPDANLPDGLSKTHGMFKAFQYLDEQIEETFQEEAGLDRSETEVISSYFTTYEKLYNYIAGDYTEVTTTIIFKGREFEIFETLNDRGKELTAFDLTRNLLIHSAGSFARSSAYNNLESQIEEIFDQKIKERCKKGNSSKYDKNADSFILYTWNIKSENKITKKKYMGDFISFSKGSSNEGGWSTRSDANSRNNFLKYSIFLEKTSSFFTEFLNPTKIKSNSNWETQNKRDSLYHQITCFNYANFKQYIQIYISLRYIGCEIQEIKKWISLTEKIYFNGFVLFDNSPAKYENMLHTAAHKIYKLAVLSPCIFDHTTLRSDQNEISYDQSSLNAIYEDLKRQFCDTIELQITDEQSFEKYKRDFLKKFSLFRSTDNSRIQYILRKINSKIDDGNELALENLTVEHIVPKAYVSHWGSVEFKGDKMLSDRDDNGNTIAQNYINRLGNHTLLTQPDNSSLRDSDFDTKRTEYYNSSNLKITKNDYNNDRKKISVVNYIKWDSNSIDSRQKAMSNYAFEIWGM